MLTRHVVQAPPQTWLDFVGKNPFTDSAGGAAWTSAVIASLQALTEAGAIGSLPPHICAQLAQLAIAQSSLHCNSVATAVLPGEVAYGDTSAGSGNKGTLVPPPLQQQENTQLQLWWAVATAAACGQLGLPSPLGETLRSMLADDSTADVAFQLHNPPETIMAHAAVIAGRCPKLYQAIQQQQQQHWMDHRTAGNHVCVQLGKSVKACHFRHVLEYLYTGQVASLTSDQDRLSLRKLAHALELPQLWALAAGTRPGLGAEYSPMTLVAIMPTQHVQIPYHDFMSEQSLQMLAQQHQQLQGNVTNFPDQELSVSGAQIDNEAEACHGALEGALHPVCQALDVSDGNAVPDELPVPASVLPHADLLLVPNQSGASSGMAASESLQVLPVHRAILSASSPYFAAMLSDRWRASEAAGAQQHDHKLQQDHRVLPAAHLPTVDMDVLSAVVHFCYKHEFAACQSCMDPARCHQCCSARFTVRLAAAAEAWMMPDLQNACLGFLTEMLPGLPSDYQLAVQADIAALNAWDLAQQLYIALD